MSQKANTELKCPCDCGCKYKNVFDGGIMELIYITPFEIKHVLGDTSEMCGNCIHKGCKIKK